MIKFYI